MVTFDTTDVQKLAEWWTQVVNGEFIDCGEWFAMVQIPDGVALGFQKVSDPTPGKNRLHLDFRTSDYAAECERVKSLGAKLIAEHTMEFGTWTVFEDPAGNQFCFADPASM